MSRDSRKNTRPVPAGFALLRTPLLPFDDYLRWSSGLETASALRGGLSAEESLARDRAKLRGRLGAVLARPEVREAISLSSSSLDESIDHWLSNPDDERGEKAERSLARYFARMSGRATPFGLSAGVSLTELGERTALRIAPLSEYRPHTRLDMGYICALVERLVRDPATRAECRFRPSSSLVQAAGSVRYVQGRTAGQWKSYHLVAIDATDYLARVIARARTGARPAELARVIVETVPDVTELEAREFVDELIDSEVLVPDLAAAVTGPEPVGPLVDSLSANAATRTAAGTLREVDETLARLDQTGAGRAQASYRAIAERLATLGEVPDQSRLFQVDLVKPAPKATLGRNVVAEISRGIELLAAMNAQTTKALATFRQGFVERYGDREVPLLLALDEEFGVGFDDERMAATDAAPLLQGLHLGPGELRPAGTEGPSPNWLLGKVGRALLRGLREVSIDEQEIPPTRERARLAPLMTASATIAAANDEAIDRGEFRVFLEGANSGARLLGRFCHASSDLHQRVRAALREEERGSPSAIHAEIAHLPQGRLGNVILRPLLREYEIVYMGASGAPPDRQIPASDLLVSIREGRVVLRSARLGQEIIPHLTNAHNFALGLGVYRLLALLHDQDFYRLVRFPREALAALPFVPRIVSGRVVLSLARWTLDRAELEATAGLRGLLRFRAVQGLRDRLQLPRFLYLEEGENELTVDLDNPISVDAAFQGLRGRASATLTEVFGAPEEVCARGPEGRYVHEIMVPFFCDDRGSSARARAERPRARSETMRSSAMPRSLPPGSEWLYAKLYAGAGTVDHLIRDLVAPLVRVATSSGAIDRWFFVRYGDPHWHLRLRLHGDPVRLREEVLPILQEAASKPLATAAVWRFQLDTYEREVERYGGEAGLAIAEELFHVDSDYVVHALPLILGDENEDRRWQLTLRGVRQQLDDFGLDPFAQRSILGAMRTGLMKEFAAEGLEHQLAAKYRRERRKVEVALAAAAGDDGVSSEAVALLRERSDRSAPVLQRLRAAAEAGVIQRPLHELVDSYVHMHANRMLRSAARAQELIVYDLLYRHLGSSIARSKATG